MDRDQTSYQIVLLVDENSKFLTESNSDRYVNSVRSSVLKLLTHFSCSVREESKQLQWSYKFYESHAAKRRPIQRNIFKEFSQTTFEEFENDLEINVQGEKGKEKCKSKTVIVQSQDSLDGDPLENLSSALREITFEYPWDRPDILSPVKPLRGSKRKRSLAPEDSGKHNLLFLFSPCPLSKSHLRRFADAEDSAGFISSLLPKHLLAHFSHHNRIKLFWLLDQHISRLELATDQSCKSEGLEDIRGVEIINDALIELGGRVIPTSALIASEFSSVSYYKTTSEENPAREKQTPQVCDVPLPLSSSLSFYICNSAAEPVNQGAKYLLKTSNRLINEEVMLLPFLAQPPSAQLPQHRSDPHLVPAKLSHHPDSGSSGYPDNPARDRHFAVEMSSVKPHRGGRQRNVDESSHVLSVLGTVDRRGISLDVCDPNQIYVVTPADNSSPKFTDILSTLEGNNSNLIAEVQHLGDSSRLAILKPLTLLSATLTIIKTAVQYTFHKQLIFDEQQKRNVNHQKQLEKFTDDCCKKLLKETTFNNLSSDDSLPVVTCDKDGPRLPLSSAVEVWCTSDVQPNSTEKLIDFLKSEKATDEEAEHLLAQLQKTYHNRKYKRLYKPSDPSASDPSAARPSDVTEGKSPSKAARRRKTATTPGKRRRNLSPRKALSRNLSPRKALRKTPLRRSPRKAVSTKYAKQPIPRRMVERLKTRTNSAPSRKDLILEKSKVARMKQDSPEEKVQNKSTACAKLTSSQTDVNFLESTTEEELITNAKNIYEKWIDGEGSSIVCAKTIIRSFIQLAQSKSPDVSTHKESVSEMLKNILMKSKDIREKYLENSDERSKSCKQREFQIQINLLFEIVANGMTGIEEDSLDEYASEISMMLRGISFIRDTGYLVSFMQSDLLYNYLQSCPRLLYKVYEEMMQPMPPQLEALYGSDDEESCSSQAAPVPSVIPPSVSELSSIEPLSLHRSKGKKLARYSSFDVVAKRQIAMPGFKKPSVEVSGRRSARIASSTKTKPKTEAEPDQESQKVCRNLFTGEGRPKLERRQSVAVMQSSLKTPTKSATRERKGTGQLVLKTRVVAETPTHKQKSNIVWRRQEMMRRKSKTSVDVDVVEESPEKPLSQTQPLRRSPRKACGNKLIRRNSFYVNKDEFKSRNVERYTRLEERMTRPLLSPQFKLGGAALLHRPQQQQQQQCLSTPPRRIKPAFFGMHEPSPEKAVPATVGNTRTSRSLTAIFSQMDSPSKHTRLQARLKSPEPVNPRHRSPAKVVTPKRNLMSTLKTPVKTLADSSQTKVRILADSSQTKVTFTLGDDDTASGSVMTSPFKLPSSVTMATSDTGTLTGEEILLSPERLTRRQARFIAAEQVSNTPSKTSNTPNKTSNTPSKNSNTPSKNSRTPSKNSRTPNKSSRTPSKIRTPGKPHCHQPGQTSSVHSSIPSSIHSSTPSSNSPAKVPSVVPDAHNELHSLQSPSKRVTATSANISPTSDKTTTDNNVTISGKHANPLTSSDKQMSANQTTLSEKQISANQTTTSGAAVQRPRRRVSLKPVDLNTSVVNEVFTPVEVERQKHLIQKSTPVAAEGRESNTEPGNAAAVGRESNTEPGNAAAVGRESNTDPGNAAAGNECDIKPEHKEEVTQTEEKLSSPVIKRRVRRTSSNVSFNLVTHSKAGCLSTLDVTKETESSRKRRHSPGVNERHESEDTPGKRRRTRMSASLLDTTSNHSNSHHGNQLDATSNHSYNHHGNHLDTISSHSNSHHGTILDTASNHSNTFLDNFSNHGNFDVFDEAAQLAPPSGHLIIDIEESSNVSFPSVGGDASNMSSMSLRSGGGVPRRLARQQHGSKLGSSGSGSNFCFTREGSSSFPFSHSGADSNSSSNFEFDASSPAFESLQRKLLPVSEAPPAEDTDTTGTQSPVFTSPARAARERTTSVCASRYNSPRVEHVRATPSSSKKYSPATKESIHHLIASPMLELVSTSSSSGSRGASSKTPRSSIRAESSSIARVGTSSVARAESDTATRGRTRRSLCDSYNN